MNDTQILTLALSVTLSVGIPLSMLIYSNSRITDVKNALTAEIAAAKETLRAEMATLRMEIMGALSKIGTDVLALDRTLEASITARIKDHEMEHHR